MKTAWTLITTWSTAHSLLVYYFVSVAIDQLPMPDAKSGKFYTWFFGVAQWIAANWNRGKLGVKNGRPPAVVDTPKV